MLLSADQSHRYSIIVALTPIVVKYEHGECPYQTAIGQLHYHTAWACGNNSIPSHISGYSVLLFVSDIANGIDVHAITNYLNHRQVFKPCRFFSYPVPIQIFAEGENLPTDMKALSQCANRIALSFIDCLRNAIRNRRLPYFHLFYFVLIQAYLLLSKICNYLGQHLFRADIPILIYLRLPSWRDDCS